MAPSAALTVLVPGVLRSRCGGAAEIAVEASSLRGVLAEIARRYPALHACVCDETGAVRRHVNLFVNTTHARDLAGVDTPLRPGDVVSILPAVSGG